MISLYLQQNYYHSTMGNNSPPLPCPSPSETKPSPTLHEPWRKVSWQDNERDLKYVRDYKPENSSIRQLRILLHGPVGSGKSSFINSVSSTLQGRIAIPALASAVTSDSSFTKKYQTHKIKTGRGSSAVCYPLVFNDIMGLEESNVGVHPDDIKLAMRGHVREGHKFNPVAPLSEEDPGYNLTPSADDKVHVLVCIYSANTAEIKYSVLEKMSSIRQAASDLEIPQMAIITKIDEACSETEKDLKNVYKSKHLKKKMNDFSSALGIPMNCIFPVKNYSEEIETHEDVDTLILSALRNMINFGNDFIEKLNL